LDKAKIKTTNEKGCQYSWDESIATLLWYYGCVRFFFIEKLKKFYFDEDGYMYHDVECQELYDEEEDEQLYYNEIDFGDDIKEHDKKSIRIQLKPKIDSNNKKGIIKELMNIKAI
jgi:hypothetical protein